MNDLILKELMIIVERAVRPVRTTMARKRRMREELLSHLTAIFEEEFEKLGDEQAALEQAQRRFGNPRDIAGQIQETVPLWDRIVRLSDASWFREPSESVVHFASRITLLAVMLVTAVMLLLLPVVWTCGRENEFAMRAYYLFAIGILDIPLILGIILLADGMYRALYRTEGVRCWRLAAIYGICSLVFFPALAFMWHLLLSSDFSTSIAQAWLACCFAPLAPVLFAALAKQAAEPMRHYEEWAGLEIER